MEPQITDQGWRFGDYPGAGLDTLNGTTYLHELYSRADPHFTGRATVPVLWDIETGAIVNNESTDIVRMFNSGFGALADDCIDLYPEALRPEIDAWNARIYPALNNGVYRAGFATTQAAYEEAYHGVFAMLNELEHYLESDRFLVGDRPTEADIRLFVTLVRFDVAYFSLFKCNRQRIADYPNLSNYMRELYQVPGVAGTVKSRYYVINYWSIRRVNPTGIIPKGTPVDYGQPHDRARLAA